MPDRNVAIRHFGTIVDASPSFVPIADGDNLNITNSSQIVIEMVLSNDTIGRLSPQPDGIVQIPAGGTVSFAVENAAPGAYIVQLRPFNRKVSNPGTVQEGATSATIIFLPFVTVAATGVVGGLEEFP